ncbi:hypothetical protein ACFCXH_20950, partial [Streptomyces nojiriensis]|uniref:hypothetical protein n=1 Tax=Streptomyces nojiriensis TaxID=66374 RepID=UPI0035D7962D
APAARGGLGLLRQLGLSPLLAGSALGRLVPRLLRVAVTGLLLVRVRLPRLSRLLLVRVLLRVLRVLFAPGRLLLSWPHGR